MFDLGQRTLFCTKNSRDYSFFYTETFLIAMLTIHCTSTFNVNTCCIFIVANFPSVLFKILSYSMVVLMNT